MFEQASAVQFVYFIFVGRRLFLVIIKYDTISVTDETSFWKCSFLNPVPLFQLIVEVNARDERTGWNLVRGRTGGVDASMSVSLASAMVL